MKCGQQYPASKFTIKALAILVEHPGLTAEGFAAFCFPSWKRAGWLGAMQLYPLVSKKLVKVRFEPPFWKPGKIKPKKKYYVTSKGYSVHDSYARQRYSKNGDPPVND